MSRRGSLIVFEGGEGCGKTTQVKLFCDYLNSLGIDFIYSREPGGISPAEDMRKILKNPTYTISSMGELFGFNFARAEFYDKVVIPELDEGKLVVLDRSGWSTEAYQGYAGGIDLETIRLMNKISTQETSPDVGIIIDIDPLIGLEKEVERDRFSAKGVEYHQRVRRGFLEIAEQNENCFVIPYRENDVEGMQNEIRDLVSRLLYSR